MRRRIPSPTVLLLVSALATVGCDRQPGPQGSPSATAAGATAALRADQGPARESHTYRKPYTFSEDWFSNRIPIWERHVLPLQGRPLNYLEVGVFEGRSVLWMVENVLTHPESRLTAVDIFPGQLRDRYVQNVELSGFADRATTIQGYSQQELRKLPVTSFDIIYIDGSHTADDVLADAVLSWQLLKPGGLLIFDDYDWSGYPDAKEPRTPDELRPQAAVDGFITAHRNVIEIVHRGYQLFVRKVESPCAFKEGCTPIGKYQYLWWERRLVTAGGDAPMELSAEELDVLEALLRSRAPGRVRFTPSAELRRRPELKQLEQKLGLKL